ncbi:MAG: hypothetical protein BWX88_02766 [Planctomycetes bacterium ADurb.Bin126]|nr:MAG: hypothetical protein BWX88_02766 [Planctomycetes bacterium ADurb.Bin126]HOD79949.1 hypothetical protein [Phycisphaerae bacterium]HQL73236.1 hypothetical protein [Phycisphaerae bacterium]
MGVQDQLTHAAYRHSALLKRARPSGTSSTDALYEDEFVSPDSVSLVPLEIREVLAPGVHRAKVELDLANAGLHAWQWREAVGVDDQVRILRHVPDASVQATGSSEIVLFQGFVADVELAWGAAAERVVLTCVSRAHRLAADGRYLVYGRLMESQGGSVRLYSSLPCEFNAGGRPNRRRRQISGQWVFTHDADATAAYWTMKEAVEYLQGWYNSLTPIVRHEMEDAAVGELWVDNFVSIANLSSEPVFVSVEGVGLWQAMAAVCDKHGFDMFEFVDADALNVIQITRRHGGREIQLAKQDAGSDADLTRTNLHSATVAEAASSVVAEPTVAGGATLYEVTLELYPCFDFSDLTQIEDEGWHVWPRDVAGRAGLLQWDDYCKRFCVGGLLFKPHAGRLWDANTDGRYTGSFQHTIPTPDTALAAGQASGSWPLIPFKALPMLSQQQLLLDGSLGKALADAGQSGEVLVEIYWGQLARWEPLTCRLELLGDRFGVRLTEPNLAAVMPQAWAETEYGRDPTTHNLMARMIDSPTNIRLRMTATIAGPHRNLSRPIRTAAAGTMFATSAWYDRGSLGQVRVRSDASRQIVDAIGMTYADESDGREVDQVARALQAAMEGRSVEAGLPIEWTDQDVRLTDVITGITGIHYAFDGQCRTPRVVGKTTLLGSETYQLQLATDSGRFNASILTPPPRIDRSRL